MNYASKKDAKKDAKKDQIYWVRYYFKVDSASINQSLCFKIQQLGASEVYLNGKKIESIGKIGDEKSREFRIKNRIPELFTLDNTKVNVLALRFLPIAAGKKKTITLVPFAIGVELASANEFIRDKIEEVMVSAFFVYSINRHFADINCFLTSFICSTFKL